MTTNLRNYQHASRIFIDSNYRLSPKYGFLFYVEFDFNPQITNISNTAAQELGMIVKSCNLPKFTIDTKVHNAYNRKNITQHSIKYDPIQITFHDDQADNVRNFWYDYYSFFYRDSDYADATYQIINKYQERPSFDWGYSPRPVGSYNSATAYQDYQYIQGIRIYSLYQGQFDEYELINPMITQFRHGDHVNGDNTVLEHQMQIQYEAVKYQTGSITENNTGGFIDLHYDLTPTPLGGKPNYETASSEVTDLASINTNASSAAVLPNIPITGALTPAFSFGSLSSILTNLNAAAGTNGGGYTLPALGSLTSGINNSNFVGAQLQAATVALAGTAANTLAGGVVKGLAQGLGPQGTSALTLLAAAIASPQAALTTVENMASKFVMGAISQGVNSLATSAGQELTKAISGALSPIGQGISGAFGDLSNLGSGFISGYSPGTTLYNALNPISGQGDLAQLNPDGTVNLSQFNIGSTELPLSYTPDLGPVTDMSVFDSVSFD